MPESSHIAAIVLAAGRSTRFGADKLLQPLTLDGVVAPLIVHSLRPWLQVFDSISMVIRPDGSGLRDALADTPAIRWVEAAQAGSGMGHSLAAGVAADADAAGWVIGLADMPRLPATVIARVRTALRQGTPLAAPLFQGRRGHPVGFGRAYAHELLALTGDAGARHILQRDAKLLTRIEAQHAGVLIDVDQPSDIESLTTS